MLEQARYYLALLTLLSLPWAVLFWYVVHPFIHFWRRAGARATYACLVGLGVVMMLAIWPYRTQLLGPPLATGPVLWGLALVAYGAAIWVEIRCRRYLKLRVLVGMPELAPEPGGKLLSQGIYGRIRHPRYVSVTLGMLAAALFCNYPGIWVLWLLTVPALVGVVHFEEIELRERFGEAYEEYSRRVPRFIPRSGS